jgi:hypothetical protein
MAFSNYGELQASVAAWATRSDLTTTIPDFVAWAQQEIGRRLRSRWMLTRVDLAIAGEFVSQPADFEALKSLRLDTSPRVNIAVVSPEIIEDSYSWNCTQTNPEQVAIEGAEFHFGPAFSGAPTGKLLYFATPAAMSADADVNIILTKYPYLYLYGALEALFRYLEDDNNAGIYGGQFGALIESINTSEAKDVMNGPLQTVTYGGGVV